jgi:predicted nucleotidyltransferase
MTMSGSSIEVLERALKAEWLNIRKSREATSQNRAKLVRAFEGLVAPDTSLVLFGSVARQQMTSGSDADWILLIDGQAFPEHADQKNDAARLLKDHGFGEPGRSGVFGSRVGSHGLVHQIGGEDDTNANTTRRVLLLLESWPG